VGHGLHAGGDHYGTSKLVGTVLSVRESGECLGRPSTEPNVIRARGIAASATKQATRENHIANLLGEVGMFGFVPYAA
jgi:hypothetical protein